MESSADLGVVLRARIPPWTFPAQEALNSPASTIAGKTPAFLISAAEAARSARAPTVRQSASWRSRATSPSSRIPTPLPTRLSRRRLTTLAKFAASTTILPVTLWRSYVTQIAIVFAPSHFPQQTHSVSPDRSTIWGHWQANIGSTLSRDFSPPARIFCPSTIPIPTRRACALSTIWAWLVASSPPCREVLHRHISQYRSRAAFRQPFAGHNYLDFRRRRDSESVGVPATSTEMGSCAGSRR